MASAPNGSTPMTRVPGDMPFTAAATPEARPPPPMGTTTTSRSGISSISSRPTVPCPRMMSG